MPINKLNNGAHALYGGTSGLKNLCLSVAGAVVFLCISDVEARVWTDATGRTLDADFIGFSDGQVEVKRLSDGKIFKVPIERFSKEDRDFVRSQIEKNTNPGIQVGDPGLSFDLNKIDPAYPQMKNWMEAGTSNGIPYLGEQLERVDKVFESGATEDEVREYFASPEVKYKSVVVLFKNGTYNFHNEKIRLYSRATLVGESKGGVQILVSGNSGFSLYNGENIGLRNLSIVGSWKDGNPDADSFSEDLPGKGDHRMIDMGRSSDCYVDNVRIINSASHPIWVGGNNNTIRNVEIDGAHCKGVGCQGYFFIGGEKNLITGCEVTNIRHISFQDPGSKYNVFFDNRIKQEVSFHHNDGGNNLIENNDIVIPKHLDGYNAIMGPWSSQHFVGGKNFIYNNSCLEENNGRRQPWSDQKLYIGPHFVSVKPSRDRYDNFAPTEDPLPIGRTLYPIILSKKDKS